MFTLMSFSNAQQIRLVLLTAIRRPRPCPFISCHLLYITSIIPCDCRDPIRISFCPYRPSPSQFSLPPLDSPARQPLAQSQEPHRLFPSFTQTCASFSMFSTLLHSSYVISSFVFNVLRTLWPKNGGVWEALRNATVSTFKNSFRRGCWVAPDQSTNRVSLFVSWPSFCNRLSLFSTLSVYIAKNRRVGIARAI